MQSIYSNIVTDGLTLAVDAKDKNAILFEIKHNNMLQPLLMDLWTVQHLRQRL